ncbi:MAG: hypothetical protein ACRDJW_08705 [Thermomicrobiales bacterium]
MRNSPTDPRRALRTKAQRFLARVLIPNIFEIVTIGIFLWVIYRQVVSPYDVDDLPSLITLVVTILGFLAFSGLWERHWTLRRIEDGVDETNEMIGRKLGGRVRPSDFFWGESDRVSRDDIAHASHVYIVGMILNRTVRQYLAPFGDLLAAGADLRFVMLDYENDSLLNLLPARSYGNMPREWWKNQIQNTEVHIENIPTSRVPPDPAGAGSITIGYLPYLPSFGMWLLDPDTQHGQIVVEIYHHRSAEPNPTFRLRADQDPYWYSFFRTQFQLMWESCESPIHPGRITQVWPRRQAPLESEFSARADTEEQGDAQEQA